MNAIYNNPNSSETAYKTIFDCLSLDCELNNYDPRWDPPVSLVFLDRPLVLALPFDGINPDLDEAWFPVLLFFFFLLLFRRDI
jgi:hypothetical protein